MALGKKKDEIVTPEEVEEIVEPVAEEVQEVAAEPVVEAKPEPVTSSRPVRFIMGKVVTDTALVRKEPDKYAEAVCVLKKDDVVVVNEAGSTSEYLNVTVQAKIGFILRSSVIIVD